MEMEQRREEVKKDRIGRLERQAERWGWGLGFEHFDKVSSTTAQGMAMTPTRERVVPRTTMGKTR